MRNQVANHGQIRICPCHPAESNVKGKIIDHGQDGRGTFAKNHAQTRGLARAWQPSGDHVGSPLLIIF